MKLERDRREVIQEGFRRSSTPKDCWARKKVRVRHVRIEREPAGPDGIRSRVAHHWTMRIWRRKPRDMDTTKAAS